MTKPNDPANPEAWESFVLAHGYHAKATDLVFLLGQPREAIDRLRRTSACRKLPHRLNFATLFSLRNGRAPEDDEWPPPLREASGNYQWLPPELALLATLVGRLGSADIEQALTRRLQAITGDPSATRTRTAIQVMIGRIGLQATDVVGGLTVHDAGRQIGSPTIIRDAIRKGTLPTTRVGRLLVIPHTAWRAWCASRNPPPDHYIPLASLKEPLGIRSDKLSEYARLGYIPTTHRYNPTDRRGSSKFGTWYIDPEAAKQLLHNRHHGHPMPWHGKPLLENLRATWRKWQDRQHPKHCTTCQAIWGKTGQPADFDSFTAQYPPLAHGAKRHLTRRWTGGLDAHQIAATTGQPLENVERALENGTLPAAPGAPEARVTKTTLARWITRGYPAGTSERSWLSLANAASHYQFSEAAIKAYIACGRLHTKTGTEGAARGIIYVSRAECAALREEFGFSLTEAAARLRVTIPRLQELLVGVNWRGTGQIPLATVQAAAKRLQATPGATLEDAAIALEKPVAWIEAQIAKGVVRPLRKPWEPNRVYLSQIMLDRLRTSGDPANAPNQPDDDLLRLSAAAIEAGVSTTTLNRWAATGQLAHQTAPTGQL